MTYRTNICDAIQIWSVDSTISPYRIKLTFFFEVSEKKTKPKERSNSFCTDFAHDSSRVELGFEPKSCDHMYEAI